jgi:hypothetical protein
MIMSIDTCVNTLTTLLRARLGNFWIQSSDEYRAETLVLDAAYKLGYQLKCWRASVGLFDFLSDVQDSAGNTIKVRTDPTVDASTLDPARVIQALCQYHQGTGPVLVMFEDVSGFLKNPVTARWFKDLAIKNRAVQRDRLVQVVVIDAAPPYAGFVKINLDLPTREELASIVTGMGMMGKLDPQTLDVATVVEAVMDLEATQVQRCLAQCLAEERNLNPTAIERIRKTLI